MSTGVMSVRLPEGLKERLKALADSTGRSEAFYVREAIVEHLAELEYAYTLRDEVEAYRRGEAKARPAADVYAEIGLD